MLVFNGNRYLIGAKPGNFNQDLKIQQHCCMPTVTLFPVSSKLVFTFECFWQQFCFVKPGVLLPQYDHA